MMLFGFFGHTFLKGMAGLVRSAMAYGSQHRCRKHQPAKETKKASFKRRRIYYSRIKTSSF